MEKPANKFARIIWALIPTYLLVSIVRFIMFEYYRAILPEDILFTMALNSIYAVALFGGAATLIELVDQIRWNALSPDQRAKL